MRAISLYCELARDSILDGLQQEMVASGHDIGAATEAPAEQLAEETPQQDIPASAATDAPAAETELDTQTTDASKPASDEAASA